MYGSTKPVVEGECLQMTHLPHATSATLSHMRRRFFQRLLSLLLMVSLMPGLHEVAEALEHLVHDGHLPHSEEHEEVADEEAHEAEADTEHGCTPVSHQCECHTSVVVLLGNYAFELDPAPTTLERRNPHVAHALTNQANGPPTPPPIV